MASTRAAEPGLRTWGGSRRTALSANSRRPAS